MNSQNGLHGISELAIGGLPLASGLRALSEEAPTQRLRKTLISLSSDLESGEDLNVVVGRHLKSLPSPMQGILSAGIETGNLPRILEQYLGFARQRQETRRHLLLATSYPSILLIFSLMIGVLMLKWVVLPMADLSEGFELRLPPMSRSIVACATFVNDSGIWAVLIAGASIPLLWIGGGKIVGRPMRRRLLNVVPIVGAMYRFSSLAQFCQLLAILVDNRVTLPEGLRLAGTTTGDDNLKEGSMLLATEIERGMSLAEATGSLPHFPATLQNLFRWQEQGDAFPDALRAAGEVFAARAGIHLRFATVVVEPVIIIGTGIMIGGIVLATFHPLVVLVNTLT